MSQEQKDAFEEALEIAFSCYRAGIIDYPIPKSTGSTWLVELKGAESKLTFKGSQDSVDVQVFVTGPFEEVQTVDLLDRRNQKRISQMITVIFPVEAVGETLQGGAAVRWLTSISVAVFIFYIARIISAASIPFIDTSSEDSFDFGKAVFRRSVEISHSVPPTNILAIAIGTFFQNPIIGTLAIGMVLLFIFKKETPRSFSIRDLMTPGLAFVLAVGVAAIALAFVLESWENRGWIALVSTLYLWSRAPFSGLISKVDRVGRRARIVATDRQINLPSRDYAIQLATEAHSVAAKLGALRDAAFLDADFRIRFHNIMEAREKLELIWKGQSLNDLPELTVRSYARLYNLRRQLSMAIPTIVVISAVGMVALAPRPWLPEECLSIDGSPQRVFVLDEGEGAVLDSASREVLRHVNIDRPPSGSEGCQP